ncbi:hypothetical protein N7509_011774 [Penicillium cosmopolitanum]|uniref:F-box domain-containing protein n=1 Tax=Penicillium cosmopolitanum TaxID=1131564 RepID=A0A9W9VGG9_9EURO|nr:uncharacterized protein N7509_011774 [Penicillium cosmopolitanum]KAJ5378655.1 hypothetical protein N7509_011774 [Penicillium cosmopolitanum]
MSSSQSTKAVGRLPVELWELILLQLDLPTLLTSATRVCHAWAALIQESTVLQQFLFFAPESDVQRVDKTHNLLLVDAFSSLFPKHETDEDYFQCKFTLASWNLAKYPEKQIAYLRPNASWRRMLVQQPPVYRIGLMIESFGHHINFVKYYEIPGDSSRTKNGIRMEDVFEEIFINPDLRFEDPQANWRGCFSPIMSQKLETLQKLLHRNLDVGLVLQTTTVDPEFGDMDEEDGGNMEEKKNFELGSKIYEMIETKYQKQGCKPKTTENGWWTKLEGSSNWD